MFSVFRIFFKPEFMLEYRIENTSHFSLTLYVYFHLNIVFAFTNGIQSLKN